MAMILYRKTVNNNNDIIINTKKIVIMMITIDRSRKSKKNLTKSKSEN